MPFGKRKQGNKFQVINTETGDVKGTHDTEADADKQLAALHANNADKDKGHMDIRTKAVAATITDTSASEDEFPGTFLVELSNESLDRDGDILKADEWETPLPEQITFVNDHTHKMANVVGSAKPELVNGKILCKGEWAATQTGQDTRKVIKHVPYTSVAYREKRNQKSGTVSRELINGSFVVVPSNTRTRVLASKDFGGSEASVQAIHDMTHAMGADCFNLVETGEMKSASGSVLPGGFTAEALLNDDHQVLSVKDADGKTILVHEFSQSTGKAPSKDADPDADPAKDEAAALAKAKAAAFQITSETRQYYEQELDNA
jgi:hypothetical protein